MWTEKDYQNFWKELSKKKDKSYVSFSMKIISTKYPMIGIRVPILRKKATFIGKTNALSYLKVAKDTTYEEVLMQGFVLGKLKNREDVASQLPSFLPKLDSWALCDMTVSSLKIVSKEKEFFLKSIQDFIQSKDIYTIRFALVLLVNYYVEEDFLDNLFSLLLQVQESSYYVEMAMAWLLCECFITNQEKTMTFLRQAPLSSSVLLKTIGKINDSYRSSQKEKEKVNALKEEKGL